MGVANPQSHSLYVTVQNGHLEHGDAAAEIKFAQFIVVLSLLKLYFFLPPFHALSSFLVRHFHVLHFPVL